MNIFLAGANCRGVRGFPPEKPPQDFFADQIGADLPLKLNIEPGYHAAYFRALGGVSRNESGRRRGFFKIFTDGGGIAQHQPILFDHDRQVAGWVQGQKLRPALPKILRLEFELKILFFQGKANLPANRRQP